MTTTVKYILIGGGALVLTVYVVRRMQATQQAASKPTGIADAFAGIKTMLDSAGGFSFGAPAAKLEKSGTPYGGSASDGYAAVADATGTRTLSRAIVPAQETYPTEREARLAGLLV